MRDMITFKDKRWAGYGLTLAVGLLLGVLLRGCVSCGSSMTDGDEDVPSIRAEKATAP